jgi:hypothetical protein
VSVPSQNGCEMAPNESRCAGQKDAHRPSLTA